jgi:hypothetical protein
MPSGYFGVKGDRLADIHGRPMSHLANLGLSATLYCLPVDQHLTSAVERDPKKFRLVLFE